MSSIESTNEKVFKHPLGTITLLKDTNVASWNADCEQVLHGIKAWRIVMEEEAEPENPEGITIAAIQGCKAYENFTIKISKGPRPIGCDNQGAIKLITSGVVKQKSKHIDVKYHHVHDEQTKGSVHFQHVTSAANPADVLTKPLAAPRRDELSYCNSPRTISPTQLVTTKRLT